MKVSVRKMAAKNVSLWSLVGRTATANGYTGVIVELRSNMYPVLRLAGGRFYNAGDEVVIDETVERLPVREVFAQVHGNVGITSRTVVVA